MPTTIKKTKGYSLIHIIIVLALILMLAATYFYLPNAQKITDAITSLQSKKAETPVLIEPVIVEQEENTSQAVISASMATKAPSIELPLLDKSDEIAFTSAKQISSTELYSLLLVKQEMIRNLVVFIDNFSKGDLISNFSPLIKPAGAFSVRESNNKTYLNPESYTRYDIYAEYIHSIDIPAAINQYQMLKPLIDEAYQEIGYPDEDFTNVLNQAIEVVLDTPIINGSIELISPSVMYKFADQDIESLNSAQKFLIRMGPNNLLRIKNKLQQVQHALLAL